MTASCRPLTGRQRETLQHIAAGHTTKEAAALMGVGLTTVKTFVDGILERLGARNAAHAVYLGFRAGELS